MEEAIAHACIEGAVPNKGDRMISMKYTSGLSFITKESALNNFGIQDIGVIKNAICIALFIMGVMSRKRELRRPIKREAQYRFNINRKIPGIIRSVLNPKCT